MAGLFPGEGKACPVCCFLTVSVSSTGGIVLFCSESEYVKGRSSRWDLPAVHSRGFHRNNREMGFEILNSRCFFGMMCDLAWLTCLTVKVRLSCFLEA